MKATWRAFIQGPVTRFGAANGHVIVLALGKSWHVRFVGNELVDRARSGRGPVLYAVSHGGLLPAVFAHRDRAIQILISESRDGGIITRITSNLGFGSVRGSSSRGGARAVVALAAKGRQGYDLAITPDGPRGPRGSVSPGALVVASRGEIPIVPMAVAANRAFRARSWDRFLVPLPGARVWVVYREPIWVRPGEPDRTRELESAMAAAEAEALEYAEGDRAPSHSLRVPA